jgi:hypothetical protein
MGTIVMGALESFLLGLVVALTPGLIALAFLLARSPSAPLEDR